MADLLPIEALVGQIAMALSAADAMGETLLAALLADALECAERIAKGA